MDLEESKLARCDMCTQTKLASALIPLCSPDGTSLYFCSVACVARRVFTLDAAQCVTGNGGSHGPIEERPWFTAPCGTSYTRSCCSHCRTEMDATELVRASCPTRHANLLDDWQAIRGGLGGGPLRADEPPKTWTCSDCAAVFSKAELDGLLLELNLPPPPLPPMMPPIPPHPTPSTTSLPPVTLVTARMDSMSL